MHERIAYKGITFDDVLLEPGFSDVVPRDVDVRTNITRNVRINIPILSSPMDTVTESELAIALAQEGGIGIIHKNLSIALQTREVDKVKRSENGIITDPITLHPDATVGTARQIMRQHHISGVPITVGDDKQLRGILTRRDLKFLTDFEQKVGEVMTKDNLVTASEQTTLEEAEQILNKNKVEKLLLVDDLYRLKGLITIKDIDKTQNFPNACKDSRGRLRVGAAIGVHDYERAESLIRAGVDVLVVDSAHGHSSNVIETVKGLKQRYNIDLVAGNVATAAGAKALADAGGRWNQGRDRAGFDLHDADCFRGRRPADDGDCLGGEGVARNRDTGDCRRRHSLFRRHDQSPRRRRSCGDARRLVRGIGRESGADDPVSGSNLQGLPWYGFVRCDDGRLRRSLSAGRRVG